MSSKLKPVTGQFFQSQIRYLGGTYAWVVGILIVVPLIYDALTQQLSTYVFSNVIKGLALNFVFGFFIFIITWFTTDDFQLCIQNGISRRTFFKARILSMVAITFVGDLIATIYNQIVWSPQLTSFLSNTAFGFYSKSFSSAWLAGLGAFLFGWLGYLCLGTLGMAIGSGMSLLSKRMRYTVLIAVPVIGLLLLNLLLNIFTKLPQAYLNRTWLNFLWWAVGDSGHQQAVGYFNPLVPALFLAGFTIIFTAIASQFYRRLQVKK